MDEERLQRMMEDPNVRQQMNEALNNPDFVNMLIQSNPMLRNMPNAREIISSPFMRQMMTDPSMITQAARMQRNMRGGDSAFPAPGATDTTPSEAPSSNETGGNSAQTPQAPFTNPFMPFGMMGGGPRGDAPPDLNQLAQQLQFLSNTLRPQNNAQGQTDSSATAGQETGVSAGTNTTTGQSQGDSQQQNAQAGNPFAALFGPPGGGAAGGSPFGMNPEMMQQMMQMMGGGGASQAPPDNRPPEERYEEQLRQLNDMGFFDFDRNVAALRRSGGSVQGAVEYLLSALD